MLDKPGRVDSDSERGRQSQHPSHTTNNAGSSASSQRPACCRTATAQTHVNNSVNQTKKKATRWGAAAYAITTYFKRNDFKRNGVK
mmetsp:Transcript_9384/g.15705  ORF Transcript_9384/g.15705 Transcript_9384/m.15705 type:complete len:86 (+) Transcript_9384:2341-2598(+)